MNTLSLSLRPDSLESFIGNESVTAAIAKQLSERIPVAILLSGAPGLGKTTLARIIAKIVNPEVEDPDTTNINGASENGIDRIRELIDTASYRPFSGQRKVIIIDEAHSLTLASQNALLIPTEANDSSTLWILTSSNPDKIDKALKSRCVHYALKPMGKAEISELVARAAEATNTGLSGIPFVSHMLVNDIGSPREILMAWELFAAGTGLDDCLAGGGEKPEYKDIAHSVIKGNWSGAKSRLAQIQVGDARAMRAIVSGLLRYELLKCDIGPKADALSTCLVGLGNSVFEDGIAWSSTVGLLYKCTKAIGGSK